MTTKNHRAVELQEAIEWIKIAMQQIQRPVTWNHEAESKHMQALITAATSSTRSEVPEWLPMDKFFAGNSPYYGGSVDLLLNGNARIPDCYFCYESKEFLMCGTDVPVVLDGDPINKITHWVKPLPLPQPPKSTAQAEREG